MDESLSHPNSNPHHILSPLLDKIEEAMPKYSVPGVAAGVHFQGQEAAAGLGVTSLENPLPVDASTFFQVGSITKTITTAALMRLVEAGLLELDAPLKNILPGLHLADPSVVERVTLRHLLSHTSGWDGDYFEDFGRGEDALAAYVGAMEKLEQLTPPGEIYAYNNAGFSLAGRVIEVVSAKPYEQAARDLVLDPLVMRRSFFSAEEVITYRVAAGHTVTKDRQVSVARPWSLARSANPAGGLASCVDDLLVYARFMLGDGLSGSGERILQPGSMEQMLRPQTPTSTKNEWVGLSWFIRDLDGVNVIRHGGSTHGQCAQFLFVPERQFAMVILTNSDYGSSLYTEVTPWVLGQFLGLRIAEPETVARSDGELALFTGWYEARMDRLELTASDGKLIIQEHLKGGFPDISSPPPPDPPPDRFAFIDDRWIVCVDGLSKGSYGRFLMRPDGSVAWLQLGGRLHRREIENRGRGRSIQ